MVRDSLGVFGSIFIIQLKVKTLAFTGRPAPDGYEDWFLYISGVHS
jgi:hypothetical protein